MRVRIPGWAALCSLLVTASGADTSKDSRSSSSVVRTTTTRGSQKNCIPFVTTTCVRGGQSQHLTSTSSKGDIESRILADISVSLQSTTDGQIGNDDDILTVNTVDDVNEAIRDFSPSNLEKGHVAWKFLRGIASSPTFLRDVWHKRPLLVRSSDTGGWVEESFTLENDLRLIDQSYITGYKTAEILRNGTKTDTWELAPLKSDPSRKTSWQDVSEALDGGTIYFNTAGSLWPNLGGLCRMTSYLFGLPTNLNVYVTPPGLTVSVPPHTDKQDVLVFQTQGAKRWRVYAPSPREKGKDPLSRGKTGDVLSFEELGEPLIDTVLQPGDVLYVPTGFPHTTDTITLADGADANTFDRTSVHLTMGLDTHVWFLTMAHMRWILLQRLGLAFNIDIKEDEAYWKAMETIPIGFLGMESWKQAIQELRQSGTLNNGFKKQMAGSIQEYLLELEPNRWKNPWNPNSSGEEELPSYEQIEETIEFMIQKHWLTLMKTQEELFKDVDPSKEEVVLKAFQGTQNQNLVMENLGEFSKNEAFRQSFRQRRLSQEQRAKAAMQQ